MLVLFVLHAAEIVLLSFTCRPYTTNEKVKLTGMRQLVRSSSSSLDKKNSFMVNIRHIFLSLH